jgi:hypothetical protein
VPLDARIPPARYSAAAPQQPKAECLVTGLLHLQQIYSKSTANLPAIVAIRFGQLIFRSKQY